MLLDDVVHLLSLLFLLPPPSQEAILDIKRIRVSYLRTWFIPDVIAAFPIGYILLFAVIMNSSSSSRLCGPPRCSQLVIKKLWSLQTVTQTRKDSKVKGCCEIPAHEREFSLIVLALQDLQYHNDDNPSKTNKMMRILMFVRILSLIRLARVSRLVRFFNEVEKVRHSVNFFFFFNATITWIYEISYSFSDT